MMGACILRVGERGDRTDRTASRLPAVNAVIYKATPSFVGDTHRSPELRMAKLLCAGALSALQPAVGL